MHPDMDLKPGEIVWFFSVFRKLLKTAPKRKYSLGRVSANWDRDEILKNVRQIATIDGPEIWQAIRVYEAENRWPKLSSQCAFLLRLRLESAIDLCDWYWKKCNPIDNPVLSSRPSNPEVFAKAAIITYWDKYGVDDWIEEHKYDFQEPDEGEDRW